MTRTFFVTASGTEIGKTYVTAAIIRALRARGLRAGAIKPVLSGFDPSQLESSDTGVLLGAMGRDATPDSIAQTTPWRFRAAISPDMAAAREGRTIIVQEVVSFARASAGLNAEDVFFVEGAGGVLAPLSQTHTNRDLISALRWPAILVGGTYLGSISHTLSALEVLQKKCSVACIVLSESASNPVPSQETRAAIERFAGYVPVYVVERGAEAPGDLIDFVAQG